MGFRTPLRLALAVALLCTTHSIRAAQDGAVPPAAPGGRAAQQPAAAAADAPLATVPEAAPGDEYLRGYIQAWLEQAHGLGPGRVRVGVTEGVVTLAGTADTPEIITAVVAAIGTFEGVNAVRSLLVAAADGAQAGPPVAPPPGGDTMGGRWVPWLRWLQPPPGRKTVRFPVGDLFSPPLADQKQPRFHTTWQRYRGDAGTFDLASVGFGENFGLVRWPRELEGDGWQIGISGAVFAIFNLDASSKDLLNADYIVGFPLSYRSGEWSARLRLFHQSSHLGDEFLLSPPPSPPVTRINLSYEAIELLGSWERRGYRVYGGGIGIISSDTSLGRRRVQAGFEYRGRPTGWRTSRIIAGIDVEAWNETDWDRDYSIKAGLLFRSPYGDARTVHLLLEYYDGHAPHGQFYDLEIEYFGLGLAYAF